MKRITDYVPLGKLNLLPNAIYTDTTNVVDYALDGFKTTWCENSQEMAQVVLKHFVAIREYTIVYMLCVFSWFSDKVRLSKGNTQKIVIVLTEGDHGLTTLAYAYN